MSEKTAVEKLSAAEAGAELARLAEALRFDPAYVAEVAAFGEVS